uniref:Uncharacterized protein n=1 Tax=Trichuris muris TaxID=70415 RepID=A0A5S6QBS9_TRIMR
MAFKIISNAASKYRAAGGITFFRSFVLNRPQVANIFSFWRLPFVSSKHQPITIQHGTLEKWKPIRVYQLVGTTKKQNPEHRLGISLPQHFATKHRYTKLRKLIVVRRPATSQPCDAQQ